MLTPATLLTSTLLFLTSIQAANTDRLKPFGESRGTLKQRHQ